MVVTSWEPNDVRVLAQGYRDRAEAQNMFDETKDLKRSRSMARLLALNDNCSGI